MQCWYIIPNYQPCWLRSWNFHMKQSKCKACSSSIPVSVLCRHRQQQEEKLRAVVMLLSSPLAVDQAVCAAPTRTHSSSSPFLPSSSTQLLSGEGTDAASQRISFISSIYPVFNPHVCWDWLYCFLFCIFFFLYCLCLRSQRGIHIHLNIQT